MLATHWGGFGDPLGGLARGFDCRAGISQIKGCKAPDDPINALSRKSVRDLKKSEGGADFTGHFFAATQAHRCDGVNLAFERHLVDPLPNTGVKTAIDADNALTCEKVTHGPHNLGAGHSDKKSYSCH